MFVGVALELLKSAIQKAGYPDQIVVGMDVAASEFYRSGKYDLDFKSPDDPARHISGDKLGELYRSFISGYPGTAGSARPPTATPTATTTPTTTPTTRPVCLSVCLSAVQSIEDPFDQDDWENWAKFTASTDIQVRSGISS